MAKEPYFPFYYRDFMVSTGEMTDAEVGKYLRYLIHQWEKGSIPSDPAMIQTIRFDSNLWETLEPKFPLGDDGRRRNPRLEEIRLERDQYIAKRSAAGKVGAEARWDGKRNATANGKQDSKPHGKPMASTSTSTSTPLAPTNATEEKRGSTASAVQHVVALYNQYCPSLPEVKKINKTRIQKVSARLREYPEDEPWIKLFKQVEASDFLTGRNGKWRASFDWLLEESHIIKVLEGNYDNRGKVATKSFVSLTPAVEAIFNKEANDA